MQALTLTELISVIAIISSLLLLILPTLRTTLESSRRAACMNNLRQCYNALMLYAGDNNGSLPPTNCGIPFVITSGRNTLDNNYGMTKKIVKCPSGTFATINNQNNGDQGSGLGGWESNDNGQMSYFYWGGNGGFTGANTWNGWHTSYISALPDVRPTPYLGVSDVNTAKCPLMWDVSYGINGPVYWNLPARSNHNRQNSVVAIGENVLFADGHVCWITLDSQGQSPTLFGHGGYNYFYY